MLSRFSDVSSFVSSVAFRNGGLGGGECASDFLVVFSFFFFFFDNVFILSIINCKLNCTDREKKLNLNFDFHVFQSTIPTFHRFFLNIPCFLNCIKYILQLKSLSRCSIKNSII